MLLTILVAGGILTAILAAYLDAREGESADPLFYIAAALLWVIVLPYMGFKLVGQGFQHRLVMQARIEQLELELEEEKRKQLQQFVSGNKPNMYDDASGHLKRPRGCQNE